MTGPAYKKYLLGLLLVIMAVNYVDRMALGLLMQEIKLELSLSDTQLGLMTGIAFALFYSVMGVPLARWADRGNRRVIITVTTALFGVGVTLCGVATSFAQLLLIRIGVAIGEAGCVPTAHSLIADYFTRAERPKAVSIYKLGIPLSVVIGFFGAGWLNTLYGWRMTFILLGLPAIVLALLAWCTLKEPRRHTQQENASSQAGTGVASTLAAAAPPVAEVSLKEVLVTLWTNGTFRHLLLGYSVAIFFAAGMGQWTPTFFRRSFGMESGELGTWFAILSGGCGFVGIYLGGVLASRYAVNNEPLQLKAVALVYYAFAAMSLCKFLAPNPYLAFAMMGLTAIASGATHGPFFGTIQTLIPERMRAMSIALLFLFSNLIGQGLGPLVAGALSDAFQPFLGNESLRYALLLLAPGSLWSGWHVWQASKSVAVDMHARTVDRSAHEESRDARAASGVPATGAKLIPSK